MPGGRDDGWIKLWRSLADRRHELHPRQYDEEMCHWGAWVEMLLLAEWRPGQDLQPGQLQASVRELAGRWNWTKDKTHRFLRRLERGDMVDIQQAANQYATSTITILKWDDYQHVTRDSTRDSNRDSKRDSETPEASARGTPPRDSTRDSTRDSNRDSMETQGRTVRREEGEEQQIHGGLPEERDPFEDAVHEVFEMCQSLRTDRTGGIPMKRLDSRLSKIRARLREAADAFGRLDEAKAYLLAAAEAFYDDDWEKRDRYLDIRKYLFKDDETLRKWAQRALEGQAGLSEADKKLIRRRRKMEDWDLVSGE